jgi:hypothetical protein
MSARCRWCGSREIPWQGLECDRKTQSACGSFGAYQSAVCKERANAARWLKMLELLVASYEVDQHCMDNDSNDDLQTRMDEAKKLIEAERMLAP